MSIKWFQKKLGIIKDRIKRKKKNNNNIAIKYLLKDKLTVDLIEIWLKKQLIKGLNKKNKDKKFKDNRLRQE